MRIRYLKLYRDVYSFLKKHIKSLIPKQFLLKNELFFRAFHGVFFLGNTHQCNVCLKKIRSFIKLENKDLMCPFCGSLSRNRRLWKLLNNNGRIKGNLLHVSPARSLYRTLNKNQRINYFSSDFENEFLADYKLDITNIKYPNETFDTIICYHILEHIIKDKKAMSELYRVLKPSGTIFIQTPFKEGEIFEDFSIVSPHERAQHFGQDDHVRIYSIEGLKSRLENTGFKVEVKTFYENENDFKYGFNSTETVLIVYK